MSRRRHWWWGGVVLGALLLLLAGCGGSPTSGGGGEKNPRVVDQLNREVTLPAEVNRVVSVNTITTSLLYAVQGQDKLVGIDTPSKNNEFLKKVDPDIQQLPETGFPKSLNLEQIIALKPDVVIAPGNNKPLVDMLVDKGLTVVALVPESLDGLQQSIKLLGQVLGKEQQAQAYLDYFDEQLNKVKQAVGNIPEDQKPKVYLAGSSGPLVTFSKDMLQNTIIELAGGRNVAAEITTGGWTEVSLEQVIRWDPDVILLARYIGEGSPEEIKKDPAWQQITAAKKGQVYWFPDDGQSWDMPSDKTILGIVWLASILHPDKMANIDVKAEIDQFYQKFYNASWEQVKPDVPGLK